MFDQHTTPKTEQKMPRYTHTLFTGDVLSDFQHQQHHGEHRDRAEHQLARALIENAVVDLRLAIKNPRSERAQNLGNLARVWVEGANAQITFRQVCETLNLDARWLSRELLLAFSDGSLLRISAAIAGLKRSEGQNRRKEPSPKRERVRVKRRR